MAGGPGKTCLPASCGKERGAENGLFLRFSIWRGACFLGVMTEAAALTQLPASGKRNMASEAFDALRAARLQDGAAAGTGKEPGFSDLLDMLNPLQHIPVVSQIYRHVTGDTISPQARVAGGLIYGGPAGLVLAVADAAIAESSGRDLGEHAYASLFGGSTPETVKLAEAAEPAQSPAQPAAENPPAGKSGASTDASLDADGKTPQITGSIASAGLPPQPVPQLSPETFDAILSSFADPEAAKAANAGLTARPAVPPATAAAEPAATNPPLDLMGAMGASLDKYEALKRADASKPAIAAF
jgi:hypothetical protein